MEAIVCTGWYVGGRGPGGTKTRGRSYVIQKRLGRCVLTRFFLVAFEVGGMVGSLSFKGNVGGEFHCDFIVQKRENALPLLLRPQINQRG